MRRPLSTWPWLIREHSQRLRRAFAYATGRLTADDAQIIMIDCRYAAGWYSLMTITPANVLNLAITRYGDPAHLLKPYVAAACDYTERKWEVGDHTYCALDFALDAALEWAAQDGIDIASDPEASQPEPQGDHAHA